MKKLWMVMILFMTILSGCNSKKPYQVKVFLTSESEQSYLEENNALVLDNSQNSINQITVNTNKTKQTIDGFGAAMTHSSAQNISDSAHKDEIMTDLFGVDGIKMNLIRLTIGPSDFSLENKTYQDDPNSAFDLSQDQLVIDLLKTINHDYKIISSPWSAPAYMKDSKSLNGGNFLLAMKEEYSTYLVNYIKAYQNEGLNIDMLTLQNEPLHQTNSYPSMGMSALVQATLIDYFKDRLIEEKLNTKILGFDHNFKDVSYPKTLLNSQLSKDKLDGIAFHCYDGDVSSLDDPIFDGVNLYITECSGGRWATNFTANLLWNARELFIGGLNLGVKGVLLWNIALDTNDGPTNGGCLDCRGLITTTKTGYQKNEEYYVVGHFSKFHQKGAKKIEVTSSNNQILTTGFINPNGDVILVISNEQTYDVTTKIKLDGFNYVVKLPKESLMTLKFE